MTALVWFKNDYRIHDHTPLWSAGQQHATIIGLVFNCETQWKAHRYSERRLNLRAKAIEELHAALATLNIPLIEVTCDTFDDCPAILAQMCQQLAINTVFANREYALNETRRDHHCHQALEAMNVSITWSDDHVIVPPEIVLTQQGTPYRVFSSYKKNWQQKWVATEPFGPPEPRTTTVSTGKWPTSTKTPAIDSARLETLMIKRLEDFSKQSIDHYDEQRDIPSITGTSELSSAFTLGLLSPHRAAYVARSKEVSSGTNTWISELAWRDFFRYIAFHHPWVCKGQAFNRSTDHIVWSNDEELFHAWCTGKTGIPLVDAGMRQLYSTGWMHNRVRMVTAMFLTKNCFIDWRWGERFFMEQLMDGDFPSNNGGWQWSASTGVDAAPYFRIFNPVQQAKRFDKQAEYIHHWVPELRKVNAKTILRLGEDGAPTVADYPAPIVNLKESRLRAIETFKAHAKRSIFS